MALRAHPDSLKTAAKEWRGRNIICLAEDAHNHACTLKIASIKYLCGPCGGRWNELQAQTLHRTPARPPPRLAADAGSPEPLVRRFRPLFAPCARTAQKEKFEIPGPERSLGGSTGE